MKNIIIILLITLCVSQYRSQNLFINEVMSDNESSFQDNQGEYSDWIEILNNSLSPINLSNWFLSDDELEKDKWRFPNININSGERLIIYASGNDIPSLLHANFKISKNGEALFLSNFNQNYLHVLPKTCIPENQSVVLNLFDQKFYYSNFPTPGNEENQNYEVLTNDFLDINRNGGFYPNAITIDIESENQTEFYYTTDGSIPTTKSQIWSESISLGPETLSENSLSFIPTALSWTEPNLNLPKAHVIRAQNFYLGCPTSNLISETYFVGEAFSAQDKLKIFSLLVEPEDFFSDSIGIFVAGEGGYGEGENYVLSGELGERKGRLQMFDSGFNKIIDQDVEVENRGVGTRYKPQKSIRFRAVNKYDVPYFYAPVFSGRQQEKYKAINLRSGMSSFTEAIIPDVVAESLAQDLDLDYQESETALLYINGEYWGVFDMRENLDKHYLEQYYDADKDDVTIIKNNSIAIEGSNQDYVDLLNFVKENDLTQEDNYAFVASKIDIQNFIQMNLFEMYLANWDWPHNNVKYWKSNDSDSKFRWFFFDCDACLYKQEFKSMEMFSNPNTQEWDKVLLSHLLTNITFQTDFSITYFSMLNKVLSPSNVIEKIDSIENFYTPLIPNQMARWHIPSSFDFWKESVNEMRGFSLTRPQTLLNEIQNQLGNPISIFPNPTADLLFLSVPEDQEVEVWIYNLLGSQKYHFSNYDSNGLNIEDLERGTYMIQVRVGRIYFSDKFVKI